MWKAIFKVFTIALASFITAGSLISLSFEKHKHFKIHILFVVVLSVWGNTAKHGINTFLNSWCTSEGPALRPDKLMHHTLLSQNKHVVSSNSIMSSLCASAFVPLFFFFARRSEPVCTRRAVTDARPIPRLGKDVCGWKVNSLMSTLSTSTKKFLTVCLRISLLPKGVWAVVSSFWTEGVIRQESQTWVVCQ